MCGWVTGLCPQGELIAFAHMRFMVETGIETLYVYEIQVKGTVRRAGLGKHLMQVRCSIAPKFIIVFPMLLFFTARRSWS